jgi:hypothetical protein
MPAWLFSLLLELLIPGITLLLVLVGVYYWLDRQMLKLAQLAKDDTPEEPPPASPARPLFKPPEIE